ncbi:MAG: hypothetical protein A2776_02950 [Candidatus Levybacteria bacterium RIFCSPHIGHO2_01_FULL_40_10]|nr:MAG: hypothetical protein A2776_02950 [Candidatus Levybacteria bacterium RIFCSPHIGHO2_01_FULL_40_10]
MKKRSITIGWLYPDLMNTYGDRGNIIVLTKRAEWRGINVKVEQIFVSTSEKRLATCDLLFMGGAQDTQQEIVNRDLQDKKGKVLIDKIEKETPGLFICGAYQFLGKYYKTADGKELKGLGIFPLFTENPGESHARLIGNVMVEPKVEGLTSPIVGFENHGGRTYLDYKNNRLADVTKGFGNNGKDGSEGIVYKNSFGTYLHGPILPKNPQFADLLLTKTLEHKYGEKFHLEPLDDSIETKAREIILNKLGSL